MEKKILKYIDGIPLYSDIEDDEKLFKHINPKGFATTKIPTNKTKGFNYESPFGEKSEFRDEDWLGDRRREETSKAKLPTANQKATEETINLFNNLMEIQNAGLTLFGHHDTFAYGRISETAGWDVTNNIEYVKDKTGKITKQIKHTSDIYDALKGQDCCSVFSWDIGEIERGGDMLINKLSKAKLTKFIYDAYASGCVNTICWHCNNPARDNLPYNNTEPAIFGITKYSAVKLIIDEKSNSTKQRFFGWLDNYVIPFFKQDKIKNIPIIFRPFHEPNYYNGFWWCVSSETEPNTGADKVSFADYNQLYKTLIKYLESKGVNNLLYAFSFNNTESNLQQLFKNFELKDIDRDYVDVWGFDDYQKIKELNDLTNKYYYSTKYKQRLKTEIGKIRELKKAKIIAITECGAKELIYDFDFANQKYKNEKWFTEVFEKVVNECKPAYSVIWRNGNPNAPQNDAPNEWYFPYNNHIALKNFIEFYKNKNVMFSRAFEKNSINSSNYKETGIPLNSKISI